ncbi:hypothetical protein NHX12_003804 [Muraenolepis orangiensis]|uniref:Inositol-1-monophosphatase n=1 Tax=Muraenolepis orangiensis TaxID=630683 RepID=A0A9Q0DXT8_9TELE|nr:hypothetical protein NHX12_003804 [Muraenolepis orangiensis]
MAEWTECMEFGISVAKQASQDKEVRLKSSPADLVTETDQRVEKLIISAIKEKYPHHKFPFVAISIAFAVNKQTEFGLVYSCVEDKMFSALRGKGAFLNGVPLYTSGQEEIGAERDDLSLYTMTSNIMRLLKLPVHGVRAVGTAAVDMCLVAGGGADVYYHIGMHCWDIAASALIVQEAGGVVIDTDEFDMMSRKVIAASSSAVANQIAQVVQAFPCRRDDAEPSGCLCGAGSC